MSTLSTRHRARSSQGEARPVAGLRQVTPHAAGVDSGAHESVAGVPDGDDQPIVRTFGTSTAALQTLADWCVDRDIQTVAMASTGVYGMPLCEALEARGRQCCLLSAPSMQRVPGRQSDVLDGQGIQTLHRSGVLAASWRPDADCVALRTLWRHRAPLLAPRAPPVLHMPQALVQMPSQLAHALRAVTGTTGRRMLRALVAGEREPHPVAAGRNDRCTQAAEELALALTGTWRAEQVCVLLPALARFECSPVQISACEAQLAGAFSGITPRVASTPKASSRPEPPTPPRRKPHAHSQPAPEGNTRAHILRLTGVDRVAVHGRSASLAQPICAEIGTDMRQWPDDKHCCSWLGLAPQQDLSGGTVLQSRTMKPRHRAAHAFRRAAQSVIRSHCACGAFSRRLQGRRGPAQALVATAHTIARTVYHLRKDRVPYDDIGAVEYHKRFREREMHYLQKQAAQLGYQLSPA